jgi:hypothetical protein
MPKKGGTPSRNNSARQGRKTKKRPNNRREKPNYVALNLVNSTSNLNRTPNNKVIYTKVRHHNNPVKANRPPSKNSGKYGKYGENGWGTIKYNSSSNKSGNIRVNLRNPNNVYARVNRRHRSSIKNSSNPVYKSLNLPINRGSMPTKHNSATYATLRFPNQRNTRSSNKENVGKVLRNVNNANPLSKSEAQNLLKRAMISN